MPARFTVRGARPDNYGYLHDAVYELAPGDVRLVRFSEPAFFQVNEYGDAVIDVEDGVELSMMEFPLEFQRVLIGAFMA